MITNKVTRKPNKVINKTSRAKAIAQFINPVLQETPSVTSNPEKVTTPLDVTNEVSEVNNLEYEIGEPGFVDAINFVKDLAQEGYGVIDVLLNVNERFPKELGEKALNHARDKGWL